MKKTLMSLGLSAMLCSSLSGFDYQIVDGNQMLGSVVDIEDLSVFKNQCVNYVYYQNYQNANDIEAYSANITLTGYTPLTSLFKGQGLIANATGSCTITVPDEPVLPTPIVLDGLNYYEITSPTTGKVWLDRNLGATKACDKTRNEIPGSDLEYTESQEACFGDYYQWGRKADNHQVKTSSTTTSLAGDVGAAGSSFIISDSPTNSYDWASVDSLGSKRSASWNKTDQTSVCPNGFKVPTITDLMAEAVNKDLLKFPYAGKRNRSTTSINYEGYVGYLWSQTPDIGTSRSKRLIYDDNGANDLADERSNGYPVRCIKN